MSRHPLSFVILTVLAVLCALPGLASLPGLGGALNPMLEDPMAGLALLVSAVALAGSGAFPLVIARLRANEAGAAAGDQGV